MSNSFDYDVFLSYSSKDKPIVRQLAERLISEGLRVWFDELIIRPGDMIGLKIEEGLQSSRSLILFISTNALSSEWVKLERHTSLFRDPTNTNRRFIPLRLDDVELPDVLQQFSYIDWRQPTQNEYRKLVNCCLLSKGEALETNAEPNVRPRQLHEDLRFLQSLSQEEFCEWVLMPLLEEMGYSNIRYMQGRLEGGKDVIFSHRTPLDANIHLCASVMLEPLSGSIDDISNVNRVAEQLCQILTISFNDLRTNRTINISKVFLVTAHLLPKPTIVTLQKKMGAYAEKVDFIDGDRMLTLIEEFLPSLLRSLPNPESRYLYLLCQKFIDSPTLSRLGSTRPLTILDIYTGGRLTEINIEDAKYISFALPESGVLTTSSATTLRHALDQKNCCVVLADVGSGKTTLLQKLVLDFGDFAKGEHIKTGPTPVFLSLANFSNEALKNFQSFCSFLSEHVKNTDKLDGFDLETAQKYYLLLDGFDELTGKYDEVQEYISKLASHFSKVVVTSRPSRPPRFPSPFTYYRLLPFNDENIQEFLKKWFSDDAELQQRVFKHISEHPSLKQFCRTPLILTLYSILAGTSESFEQLPVRRTAIYDQITQMLLGKWDRLREVMNRYDADLKLYILEKIAFETHLRRSRAFTSYQLTDIAREILLVNGGSEDPAELLNEIVFRASLIRPTSNIGEYEFVHLSFQEYLAARRIYRHVENLNVADFLENEWWKGCLIFYFGITRTLDGLTIPRKLRSRRGIGLRLIEFLTEADFTSVDQRLQILAFLGKDLLGSGKLSSSDLQICSRLGNSIVNILDELVTTESFSPNYANYFAILRSVGSHQATNAIWKSAKYLDNLPALPLIEEVATNLSAVGNDDGGQFIISALVTLSGKLATHQFTGPMEVKTICGYMIDIGSFFDGWSAKRLVNHKVVATIQNNWRDARQVLMKRLSNPVIFEKLSVSERRQVFECILQCWTGKDSMFPALLCLRKIEPLVPQTVWRDSRISRASDLLPSRVSYFIRRAWVDDEAVLQDAHETLKRRHSFDSGDVAEARRIFERILDISKIWIS